MTSDSPTTAGITPDPRLEKRTRRRFSAPEKLRLLAEADALPHGEQGAWLRRNGLHAAQLSGWRKPPESCPRTRPYKWWNWHELYVPGAAIDPEWDKVSEAGEAAFREKHDN